MTKIFPKVTTSYREYLSMLTNTSMISAKPPSTAVGYYCNGRIWVRTLSPSTIGHEFTHHIFCSIGNRDGGTRLFMDIIDTIQDQLYHFVKYKKFRTNKHLRYSKELIYQNIEDWLGWILCKPIKEIEL